MRTVAVAIIGAGPAGSATAISLAQRGYEVALIDKKLFPREKLCGDFVNPINWPVFRELGVESSILAQPHARVAGFRMTTVGGGDAVAQFISTGRQPAIGLGLRRVFLDQVLLERAAQLGVTVRHGKRIDNLARTAQGWQIGCAGETWRARILIGADGRNSWVALKLGLNRRAAEGRSVGFQCRFNDAGAGDGEVGIHLFPGGYAGIVGLGDGTINLGLAIDRQKLPRERSTELLFSEILPRNPFLQDILYGSERVSEVRSVYPVYFPGRRCFSDALLLVGDAARVSEPVTGEGIYFAMRSGLLAAEAVDRVLCRGDLTAAGLRIYREHCQRAFRGRRALNRILRFAMYRPALLDPFIRLSARHNRMLGSLVNAVCAL